MTIKRWDCDDKHSRYYSPELIGCGWTVRVNGLLVDDCVAGDVQAGWIEIHVRGLDGHYRLNPARTAVKRRRLYGRIELIPPCSMNQRKTR